jgi:hypothetical protein
MAGQTARIFGIHPDSTRLVDSVLSVTGNGRTPGVRALPWACWWDPPWRLQLKARVHVSDGKDKREINSYLLGHMRVPGFAKCLDS